jgi:hypothetical protein
MKRKNVRVITAFDSSGKCCDIALNCVAFPPQPLGPVEVAIGHGHLA